MLKRKLVIVARAEELSDTDELESCNEESEYQIQPLPDLRIEHIIHTAPHIHCEDVPYYNGDDNSKYSLYCTGSCVIEEGDILA